MGFFQISSRKAFEAGWTQRLFSETAADYLWSLESAGPDLEWTDELTPDVEARVLEQWTSRS